MNLTRKQLMKIIKEEIDSVSSEPESPLERAERLAKQHDLGLGFGEINHLVDIILDNPEASDKEIIKLVHAKVNPQMIGQSSDLPWGEAIDRMIEEEIKLVEQKQLEKVSDQAEEILDKPKADKVFDALAAKPEVAAALEAVLVQAQQTNEANDDGGGLYGPEDGNVAAKAAGVGIAGATMMASPILASVVMNSSAGQQLMDALSPYIDPALTALGMGGAVMAGSTLAAVAIALAASTVGKN